MKIMFVARAIDGVAGGVERMVTTLMNALAERGHVVSFLTWDRAGAASFYPMRPEIEWCRMDMGDPFVKAGPGLRLRRALKVRRVLARLRPDVVVCFQDGPYMAVRTYAAGMGIPVVAAERNAPTRFDHTRARRRRLLTFLLFRLAGRVLVQCESYRAMYPAFLRPRITVISNPVAPAPARATPDQPDPCGRFRLLAVGRLGYQKNHRVLVEAFAALARQHPAWDLHIVGEGECRPGLEAMIREAGLGDRVTLSGAVADVSAHYAAAHLFCLPSLWEGFPNALAEAFAHGLPAVGYAGCAGTRDLIADGENGLQAAGNGDPATLASALDGLMADAGRRADMGRRAIESVKSFTPADIFDRWETVLAEVIERKPSTFSSVERRGVEG